jgi:hypothetical protein
LTSYQEKKNTPDAKNLVEPTRPKEPQEPEKVVAPNLSGNYEKTKEEAKKLLVDVYEKNLTNLVKSFNNSPVKIAFMSAVDKKNTINHAASQIRFLKIQANLPANKDNKKLQESVVKLEKNVIALADKFNIKSKDYNISV